MNKDGGREMKDLARKMRKAMLFVVLLVAALAWGCAREMAPPQAGGPPDFSEVAEKVMPSLVKIENQALASHPPITGFGRVEMIPAVREGAGFFVGKDGLILTNYHVVDGAQALNVITRDRKSYEAKLVGADALSDIALIKIEPDGKVTPAVLGDSDKLKVGQWVMAMGNPLGLEFFTSAGIVSGFGPPGRNYIGFYDFVQIDVNIKPGNSGGPLLNAKGEVVGLNNAYMGPGTGIGFAIPINRAKQILHVLEKEGTVRRAFLGVVGQPVSVGLAERLGLSEPKGAMVSDVLDGSPAEAGGIKEGDVVLSFNGQDIKDDRQFQELIYTTAANEKVKLVVFRDGAAMNIPVKLGEIKPHRLFTERVAVQCGITMQELSEEMAARLGMEGTAGLLVLKVVPGCPAYDGGLRFGDIVTKVENRPVNTVAEFYRAFSQVKAGSQVLIQVIRDGRPVFLTIRQGEAQ